MANPLLKLKRGNGAPASLSAGEPAYDLQNEVLYIGDGTNLDKIGGKGAYLALDGNQTVAGVKTFSETITGSVSGNAGTATTLQTARDISLTGDVTGTASAFNGSLIGYNAYALSIKASFEPPTQTYFLLDKKRGRTMTAPIYL